MTAPLRFLARRLLQSLLTLLIVSVVVFALAQLLPGDVGRTMLGPFAGPAQVHQLDHQLGVDRPLPVRYAEWLGNFVEGDWGTSLLQNVPVRGLVLDRLRNSVLLGAFALVLIAPLSIGLGVLAGIRHGKLLDRVISVVGLSFIALPEFVSGMLLLIFFSVKLGWFPISSNVPSPNPVDIVRQFLLPSIPLMLVLFGYVSRMARAGTIDVLRSNYTRTAVLKRLPPHVVIGKHVLRNALLPTIGVITVQVGYLVGGLVVVETLFSYPGIGKLSLDSAIGHDLPVLQATVLITACVYMASNFIADVLYAILNPQIRLAAA